MKSKKMKSKSHVYILVILALVVGISICSIFLYGASQRSKAFDKFEMANAEFRMRVTAYHEFAPYALPGARYVFQSSAAGSEDWHEILTFKADQAISIPRNQIRLMNDRVAYAFIGNYYMATTDSGRTWFVWDANTELPVEQMMDRYNLWPAITTIDMQSDGAGRMTLYQYSNERKRGPDLHTLDFGRRWTMDH